MGDAAGQASAQDRANKWNAMLDALADHQRGEVSAEEVIEKLTEYVVSIHNIRITRDK